jgi:hypothetical protein
MSSSFGFHKSLDYSETTERSLIARAPPHFLRAVMVPSNLQAILFTRILVMITLTSNKYFVLVDIGQRAFDGMQQIDYTEWEDLSSVLPAIH